MMQKRKPSLWMKLRKNDIFVDIKSQQMGILTSKVFCGAVQKACGEYLLLAEKYQECMR